MNITEDYVSLEIAKLLKEKGFDINVQRVYNNKGSIRETYCEHNNQYKYHDLLYPCATLQMALKWLREVHKIYIDILTYTTGKNIQFRWIGYDNGRLFSQEEGRTIYFESYEQAVEAALKYTLEKLI